MSTYTYIRVNYTWLWENMADTSQFIFISHHAGCTEAKLLAKTDGRATSKRLTLLQIVAMSKTYLKENPEKKLHSATWQNSIEISLTGLNLFLSP